MTPHRDADRGAACVAEIDSISYPAGAAEGPGGRLYVTDFFGSRLWQVSCP